MNTYKPINPNPVSDPLELRTLPVSAMLHETRFSRDKWDKASRIDSKLSGLGIARGSALGISPLRSKKPRVAQSPEAGCIFSVPKYGQFRREEFLGFISWRSVDADGFISESAIPRLTRRCVYHPNNNARGHGELVQLQEPAPQLVHVPAGTTQRRGDDGDVDTVGTAPDRRTPLERYLAGHPRPVHVAQPGHRR